MFLLLPSCVLILWFVLSTPATDVINSIVRNQNETRNAMDPLTMDMLAAEHQDAVQANETDSASIQIPRTKWFFRLWTHDFSTRDDMLFIMEFAAELSAQGHRVLLEGPKDGWELQQLDPGWNFGARINPRLQDVLSGHNIWDAIGGEPPDFLVLFSNIWRRSLLNLTSQNPSLRLVWYFYKLHRCDQHKDRCSLTHLISKQTNTYCSCHN